MTLLTDGFHLQEKHKSLRSVMEFKGHGHNYVLLLLFHTWEPAVYEGLFVNSDRLRATFSLSSRGYRRHVRAYRLNPWSGMAVAASWPSAVQIIGDWELCIYPEVIPPATTWDSPILKSQETQERQVRLSPSAPLSPAFITISSQWQTLALISCTT